MKIKQISPQESGFLKRLEFIALKPKMLYYYGELPEIEWRSGVSSGGVTGFDSGQDSSSSLGSGGCEGGSLVGLDMSGFGTPRVVAIVGARKMTSYGKEMAYKLAFGLAKAGVIVVSGLATGIDGMAHRGALDAGGVTIGVLGTPIDRFYPKTNQRLGEEIIRKGGAILSECPPFGEVEVAGGEENRGGRVSEESGRDRRCKESGARIEVSSEEIERWRPLIESRSGARSVFLRRNRLISGVADAVIVVEADLQSGSLNTASHALEQGRLLFAVPGDVSRRMSRGCNNLFGKGAIACTAAEDVLDELGMRYKKKNKVRGDTPAEQAVISALRNGINKGEEMLEWIEEQGWKLDGALFNQTITMLEIKGAVKRMYQNQWVLR